MANIVPYINFAKNGQEAIMFYKGVFGGDAEVQFEQGFGVYPFCIAGLPKSNCKASSYCAQ